MVKLARALRSYWQRRHTRPFDWAEQCPDLRLPRPAHVAHVEPHV